MKNALTIGFVLAASVGCKKKAAESTDTKGSAMPPADAVAVDAEPMWDGTSTLTLTEGFATPESVLYDPDADIYLVSNINGTPLEADDNGYITKVSPDGKIIEAKWIDGTKDDVKLDAPKGMAIANGLLYVSDINVVRKFDLKTGEPKGEIKVDKATFLNDVANAPDGGIYVTDSGLDAKFASTGTDAVYVIGKDDKVKPLIKNKALASPNGVIGGEKGGVWVVTFGSGEIYAVDAKGKQAKGQKLPKGQNDGVVALEGGEFLVSSWEGSAIYAGKPGGEWKPIIENVKSPADIGYDTKRHRILIPVFQGNTVIIQPRPQGVPSLP
jgi:sugar lactone lactonase YvrE